MLENMENTGNFRNPDGTFAEGNPGRPKGSKNFTTKVKDALMKVAEGKDYTYEEAFIKAILKKAIVDQDSQIMRLIWNYLDGMPTQKVDQTNDGSLFIKWLDGNKDSVPTEEQSTSGDTQDDVSEEIFSDCSSPEIREDNTDDQRGDQENI